MVLAGETIDDYEHSLEYPCVTRFRHRRLITFLSNHGFGDTCSSLIRETGVVFSVPRLRELVEQGQWEDAVDHLIRYMPDTPTYSVEAVVLVKFLLMHLDVSRIVAGTKEAASIAEMFDLYVDHNRLIPAALKCRCIFLTLLYSDKARASLDWGLVRLKASEIVNDLAYKTPELKCFVLLPRCSVMPQDVLPMAFGFRPRRHVKKEGRARASSIARVYLARKNKVRSSRHHQECTSHDSPIKAKEWLVDILEESLQAGKRQELHQAHSFQISCKEGATGDSVSQKSFGNSSAESSEMLPLTNATTKGTNEHMSREGCCSKSAQQGFLPRKNPTTELTSSAPYSSDPKRARLTGIFGDPILETGR